MLAPSQIVSDLQRARNLIADPERWCIINMAQDAKGLCELDHDFGEPVRFCAAGADCWVRGAPLDYLHISPQLARAARQICEEMGISLSVKSCPAAAIWTINDDYGHQAALSLFDRAIALAIAERV